jgi:hypothetical protein
MSVTQPLEGAEYLPLKEPGMAQAYLVRGKWQELWTYDVCGANVEVPIEFVADGMGGATFTTRPGQRVVGR